MRRFITIFILLTSVLACDFKSANENFAEAEKLSEQKKIKEAITLLDEAIAKDNKFLGAYINRGADKSLLGEYESAIADYKKVLQLDPKNTMAMYNIGNNYKRLKDYVTAIEYYNKAFDTKGGQQLYLDLVPSEFADHSEYDIPGYQIHYERAIAYYRIDSLKKAYTDFSASLNKNYMPADCYYWIGLIYISTGQNDLACEYFKKSKELGDKDAVIELNKYCKEK